MKVLAICGSPRGSQSQTRRLAEAVLSGAKEQGAEVELVDLGKAYIRFCRSCETCHRGPDCALDDDGAQIVQRMLESDCTVLATPVYMNQVTAQLKTILDRTSHFVHCLRMTGKYVAAVTTSGGGMGSEVSAYLKSYALTVGAQFVGSVDAQAPVQEASLGAARKLGAGLVAAVREKTSYPDQIQAIEAQKRRFGQIVAMRKDQWPYEHKYWQEQGWM
jgi:multimeric flavodoxin WrbA